MGSTRLPGKVLMDLGGQSVLSRVTNRISRAALINESVIATTDSAKDDSIVAESIRLGSEVFRGPEQDVLRRYVDAAEKFSADVVVRITSDCPLIDPGVADEVLHELLKTGADYACNDVDHGFPRGLDVEAFPRNALRRALQVADSQYQREHVTPIFYQRPDIFHNAVVRPEGNFSQYRWTLDSPEDLALMRAVYEHFSKRDDFTWREVITLMEDFPEIAKINSHITQKSVYETAEARS